MDSWLSNLDALIDTLPAWAVTALGVALLLMTALAADFIAKRRLIRGLRRITQSTRLDWDDAMLESGVIPRFAHLLPALVIYFGLPIIPGLSEPIARVGTKVTLAYMVLVGSLAISATLTAANTAYERLPIATERPLKGFLQVAKIVVFALAAVLIVAVLIERSPVLLLSGLGAMMAVLILVFRDTILSLVASVQLTSLDMIRVGDWIEMPGCNADGDVVDISLHTVKVQNWDKTITTIPTHKLIAESFKNWRGMSLSGGRRIKRSLYIDLSSIRFLTDAEVERFKGFRLLEDYIAQKENELAAYNEAVGESANANLRRLTNVGTFRAYIFNYLKHHPRIHEGMTLLVRQLQPSPLGLPLEIYAFTNVTDWSIYEDIQSDIFDHLMAIVGEFGLRVYQQPSGEDIVALGAIEMHEPASVQPRTGS
ncbi:MAG: mechanosensitive ion channel family protein [Gammaproteobacteria bacterium]|nr:mechanosensitive ion channel family protein [Gammaproteobacteria bacterium]MDH3507321.1 mechanosensitive ion channel family protein [Gammaproteobacteria bacterium]